MKLVNIPRTVGVAACAFALAAANAAGVAAQIPSDSIDMIVPTKSFDKACAPGIFADVVCQTDNGTVSYYMDRSSGYGLESEDQAAVKSAMSLWGSQTDLNITYDSTPVFSGSGETDVVFQEGAFGMPDDVVGVTWCDDPVTGGGYRCDQTYIRIRGGGNYSVKVAAHEAGHAFGLTHGGQASPTQQSCSETMGIMRAALSCLTSSTLGGVAIANINKTY